MKTKLAQLFPLLLMVCSLAACALEGNLPVQENSTPSPLAPEKVEDYATRPAQALIVSTTTNAVPTFRPTSTSQRAPTRAALAPSGWSVYSNPDFVQGLAVYEHHLWAATLRAVVDWDLETLTPVVYTPREGLVEIQSNDVTICPMPEERVIVSHEAGNLSAYNLRLKKWSQIPISFDDGSILKGVTALFCDTNNNRLLVGSAGGLGILDLKTMHWEHLGAEDGLQADTILSIDVVGQSIWVAAGKQSAFLIMGRSVFPFNGASGFPSGPVNDLSVAPDSTVWFAYPTGLVRYKDKRWYSYGSQSLSGGIPFKSVDQVEVMDDKTIWIASANEGICPFDRVTHFCSTIYPAPQGSPITDLVVGINGIAYASTDGEGILVLQKDQRSALLVNQQKLVSNNILDISENRDGVLYIATDRGINKIDPARPNEPWDKIVPQAQGLVFSKISGVLPIATGIWYASEDEPRVSFQNETGWLNLDSSKGISGRVLDLAIDQRGYAWFATDKGVDIWDGVTMRSYGSGTGLPGNEFRKLFAEDDAMWVGTDQGLLRYQWLQWNVIISGTSVNDIARDKEDGLLLGTDEGLVLYDGSQSFQWMITLDGRIIKDLQVTALSVDRRGDLWVGTAQDGLFHYDRQTWEQFDTTRGMPTNTIRTIFTDRLGAVWVAATTGQGGGGLVRFMP